MATAPSKLVGVADETLVIAFTAAIQATSRRARAPSADSSLLANWI
jgi:hypothetical protein